MAIIKSLQINIYIWIIIFIFFIIIKQFIIFIVSYNSNTHAYIV